MLLNDRIKSFAALGTRLENWSSPDREELLLKAGNENSWFTKEHINLAIDGIGKFLNTSALTEWSGHYSIENLTSKKVGLITAGNIPLVGFHDILCVLISGHHLLLKISSKDQALTKFILNQLIAIDPSFESRITITERLNDADAFIATGSDNSARYFEYYFKDKAHIIRKNRSSVAVLTGSETENDFIRLGKDIFQYFGLGCRNVSKVYVPEGYDFVPLLDGLKSFEPVIHHHKYRNNYDYNKSIYLVNRVLHLDTEFLLVKESEEMISPISVLYYQTYKDAAELASLLEANESKIQCVVGKSERQITFGEAQLPNLHDYADGVDTMDFLQNL
ncbi:MAG: acyl-CoA reductase [Reichenbachiella sp.]|uniref:acyl-CoA reductase n=1 Tax=Reichenbachiella sp. TaxID=2184521 RepID=UPI00326344D5